ncbi:MAG: hypothetical protein IVW55_05170 [Chloroflexi bacterium]|nr:hypothetical protein [Chloroflexota bacterium]
MSENSRFGIGTAILIAVGLVIFGLVITSRVSSSKVDGTQAPTLVSMEESAQAMQQAGQVMQKHGQEMLDEAKRTGNTELEQHGQHWANDGKTLVENGDWMSANPTSAQSLHASPGELQSQGSWSELNSRAQAMIHDPSQIRGSVDVDALLANGETMLAEGRNMSDHGRVMAEEAGVMVERHNLQGQAASDLSGAAQTMRDVGTSLARNGQEMVDYAARLRRSLGYSD